MMQDILTTLATAIEIAALAYFGFSLAGYVIQQSSPALQCSQLVEPISAQPELAEVASEAIIQSEVEHTIPEEAIQPAEVQQEPAPDVTSSTKKQPGVRELRLMARERGIKGFARKNKAQLLALLT